jgi:hypothetical protein
MYCPRIRRERVRKLPKTARSDAAVKIDDSAASSEEMTGLKLNLQLRVRR